MEKKVISKLIDNLVLGIEKHFHIMEEFLGENEVINAIQFMDNIESNLNLIKEKITPDEKYTMLNEIGIIITIDLVVRYELAKNGRLTFGLYTDNIYEKFREIAIKALLKNIFRGNNKGDFLNKNDIVYYSCEMNEDWALVSINKLRILIEDLIKEEENK